jgi:hypothetical protein
MNQDQLKKMSLRQVMDYTKTIPINEGALTIFFEKLVSEIEFLNRMFDLMHKYNTRDPYQ